MASLETAVKDRLGIKWVDARDLVQQAKSNLGIAGGVLKSEEDDVVDEAVQIFGKLPKAEQERMRKVSSGDDWKEKAARQAEKRQQDIREENERAANPPPPPLSEQLIGDGTIQETSTTESKTETVTKGPQGGKTTHKRVTCYCDIL